MAKSKYPKLTKRQGKSLRFVVSRTLADPAKVQNTGPVIPANLVVKIDWSDLPHTLNQASSTLSKLAALGLAKRVEQGFVATEQGISLIRWADQEGLWRR